MPDLATAFREARMATAGTRTAREVRAQGVEIHCLDPWIIARAEPNRERIACISLRREGFESYYPAGRSIRRIPRRSIPWRQRNARQHELIEDVRPVYPGYVFIRRMGAVMSLNLLWELTGMIGACAFGDQIATIADHRIEGMRWNETDGAYDRFAEGISAKEYRLAKINRTEAAKERWESPPRLIGKVDESRRRGIYLIEEFGRITRIIAATGDLTVPAL